MCVFVCICVEGVCLGYKTTGQLQFNVFLIFLIMTLIIVKKKIFSDGWRVVVVGL